MTAAALMPRCRTIRPFGVALLFLAANLLGFLVFTLGPVSFSLVARFTNWNLQQPEETRFIGVENFRELLIDQSFGSTCSRRCI